MKTPKQKTVNFGGILVGLIFLGLSALFINWARTDQSSGVYQGIFLFGGIGIFFIYQSLRGKSTSSIFKTDVGGVAGVSPGTTAWSYLKWVFFLFLAVILIVALLSVYRAFYL